MIGRLALEQKPGGTWAVRINGADIAESVLGMSLRINGAGMPANVTLELIDLTDFEGVADVVIEPVLHSVLLQLGWTPPQVEPEWVEGHDDSASERGSHWEDE